MRGSKHMVAAFDLLVCLLLVFVIQANPPRHPGRRTIPTPGALMVTAAWAPGANDDVDLYVRDPAGNVCYFLAQGVGLMRLEHDDQGSAVTEQTLLPDGTRVGVRYNGERVQVLRLEPGEYTVNVQMYQKNDPGARPVDVKLWRVRGALLLHRRRVVLGGTGTEATAFRFEVSRDLRVSGYSRVPADLVGAV